MAAIQKPRRGRPQKFGRPAQPVTISLPDDVVDALRSVDPDLSRAIVRMAESTTLGVLRHPPAELSRFGRSAVIVILPCRALERLPGVDLVPLPDGRALISLDRKTSNAEFDVMIRDVLDGSSAPSTDRAVLESLRDILKSARLARNVSLRQRSIIVLETRRTRRNAYSNHPDDRE